MAANTEKADLQPMENIPPSGGHAQAAVNQNLGSDALDQSECSNVCINDIVVDLTPMLSRLIGSEIQLRHELEAGIGLVWGDASLLEKVLINLTMSAREAMPEGGTLSISTEIIKDMLDAHRTPKGVRLTVSDSGAGTDAASLMCSCEPDLTTKPISTSLAAAYTIVQKHRGVISINSELGHGTDIVVELPFSNNGLEHAVQHLRAQDKNTPTILLAEDVFGVRSRVYSILTKAGYKVLNAHDGQNAIDMLSASKNKIDLCLFDVAMPEVNGFQAYNIIRQRKFDVPVIFMAGSRDSVKGDCAEPQPVYKPFSRANILSRVKSCLNAGSAGSSVH